MTDEWDVARRNFVAFVTSLPSLLGPHSPQDVVVHCNATGVASFHSPLEHGPVRCDFCEQPGNRIYLSRDD